MILGSCELLSNFISLTDWKQPLQVIVILGLGCELLSNFISLTDWKQLLSRTLVPQTRCELLSNFISLTDWKQHGNLNNDSQFCCELLSNFISLTDWKQHNLDKELSHNYLDYVSRIKKSDSDIGFFVYIWTVFLFRTIQAEDSLSAVLCVSSR